MEMPWSGSPDGPSEGSAGQGREIYDCVASIKIFASEGSGSRTGAHCIMLTQVSLPPPAPAETSL